MTRYPLTVSWTVALLLATATVGHAAATAGSCAAAKQKAAGKSAAAQLGCHAKATQGGTSVDPTCLQKATGKFATTFAKIEAKGACVLPGFAAELGAMADTVVADLVNATPPSGFAKCAAAKQKLAGKRAAALLGCHAKATKAGGTADPACLAKADAKFAAGFAKEELKSLGGCAAFGIAPSVAARVDTFVANVLRATPVAAPTARCCTNGGASFCADLSPANEAQCGSGYGGVLAGPGSVCDGASGDCLESRTAATAGCCDTFTNPPGAGLCLEGAGAAAQCVSVGGTFHLGAKCLPAGGCGLADAPDATGPWAVGHRQLASVDTSRPPQGDPAGRSLPLEVWYPVDPADAYGPFTEYTLTGPFTLPSALAHEDVTVSSAGPRPLIVFSHGSGGIAIQSVALMERLASHGFVVVAPNHTGNTSFDNSTPIAQALLDRVPDVSFVIDHMTTRAATLADPFYGRIDGLNVGVAGHSLGGFTALAVKAGYQSIPADARVQAIMPIAPAASALSDAELGTITVPTLFMTGTLDPLLADEVRAAGLIQSSPFNYRADVIGANHTHFANVCDIGNALIAAGFGPPTWPALGAGALVAPYNATCIPPAFSITEASRLQNLYATAFFRRHLLGETVYDPFLTTAYATANEPDITFIVTP